MEHLCRFAPYCCADELRAQQEELFQGICDAINFDLVIVTLPKCAGVETKFVCSQQKLLVGTLCLKEYGAMKEWERVCIVDERFQWDGSLNDLLALVPGDTIGVAYDDTEAAVAPTDGRRPTMVVMSAAHYGLFHRVVDYFTQGKLFPLMRAMEQSADPFMSFLMNEAKESKIRVCPIAVGPTGLATVSS